MLNNMSKKRNAKTTSTASTNAADGAKASVLNKKRKTDLLASNDKENKANPKPSSNKKFTSNKSMEKKMNAKAPSPEMKSAPEDSMKPSAYSSDEDEAESPKKKSAPEDLMNPSDYTSSEDEADDEDDEWEEGMD
jgi:hypothetical protein